MTNTEQGAAAPAKASADYQKTIRVKAHPGALFDALTTVSGLAAWWNPLTGSGDAGGELKFFMNSPEPLVIDVDQATRPTSVQWTVTDRPFLPDWVGTRATDIAPHKASSHALSVSIRRNGNQPIGTVGIAVEIGRRGESPSLHVYGIGRCRDCSRAGVLGETLNVRPVSHGGSVVA